MEKNMKDVRGHVELYGKPAHIFAEEVEQEAYDQFAGAMALPCAVKGALMPDAHTGYTLPIGAVVATEQVVYPAFVGYDIGCGMCAVPTSFRKFQVRDNAKSIHRRVREVVPMGFVHNTVDTEWDHSHLQMSDKLAEIFKKNGLKQLGSLGSGNHFIEIGYDEQDQVWVILHSGSRGIGHATATHYMKLASGDGKAREGYYGLRSDSTQGKEYINDLAFCLEFALQNRKEMLERVVKAIHKTCAGHADWDSLINRNHNHAEFKDGLWIHRKGATHAEAGMGGVIPGNMRDGSFIVEGKGNPESLFSSSHGAGRRLGRKEAERNITLSDFEKDMVGIESSVCRGTIDESPKAYKDIFKVMALQTELVEVKNYVKPLISIKDESEDERKGKRKKQ
jgi:tRNA-splicing ligase RtcB